MEKETMNTSMLTQDKRNGTQKRNGNILCAQIAMYIRGIQYAVTCRDTEIHIERTGVHYIFQDVGWKNLTFVELNEYIENNIATNVIKNVKEA